MELFTIFLWVGISSVLLKLVDLVKRLRPYLTAPLDLNDRYIKGKKDVWAVVTGASEGAGRDWAIELSKKGFNIILIARTISKLEKVAKELDQNVKSKIISKDFSKCDDVAFSEELKKELAGYNIGALINNVGIIEVERYEKISAESIANHIKINMIGMSVMTSILFDKLYSDAKKDKRRSLIVSMSSYSAEQHSGYYQIYASTKKYIHHFMKCLEKTISLSPDDYKDYIDLLTIRPYFMKTAMTNFKSIPFTITTDAFMKGVMSIIGKTSDASGTIVHELNSYIGSLIPDYLKEKVVPHITWNFVKVFGFKKAD